MYADVGYGDNYDNDDIGYDIDNANVGVCYYANYDYGGYNEEYDYIDVEYDK